VQATRVHLGAYIACRLRRRSGYRVVVRPTGLGPDGDLASLTRMLFWPLWRGGDAPTCYARYAGLVTDERLYLKKQMDAFVRRAGLRVRESFMHGEVPTGLARNLEQVLPGAAYRLLQRWTTYGNGICSVGERQ
jgi:hypothetical protein